MNILFSEGSSTSSRQSLTALGPLGYTIDLCDPQRLCLSRFSRYVRAWHRCPAFARQPAEYLDFLVDRLRRETYDVLLAVHDQVLLISRYRDFLRRMVGLAVPEYEAVRVLQSKVRFAELLAQLKLPQPAFRIMQSVAELEGHNEYPCYLKQEFGTAGQGVWPVQTPQQMREISQRLRGPDDQRFIVQQPAAGDFYVVQAVFQHGRLLAGHCYTLRARGVGGSAHARQSIDDPRTIEDTATLGAALAWHGALHMEYFVDPVTGDRRYLEANPRIGETVNATWSGVNLCDLLVQVSLDRPVEPPPPSRPGTRTHSLMMSLLGAAERGQGRRELVAEIIRAGRGEGVYSNSRDELTRLDEDPQSLIPFVAVAARLLVSPSQAKPIIHGAVESYSLGEEAIRRVHALPQDYLNTHKIMDHDGIRS